MARKACSGNFHEKATETLIGHNVGKDCGCLSNFFFDFEDALTSFKSKKFDQVLTVNTVKILLKDFYWLIVWAEQ